MTTRITAAVVICDRCGASSTPFSGGIGPTRVEARKAGWTVSGGGLSDLCPSCRKDVAAEEPRGKDS